MSIPRSITRGQTVVVTASNFKSAEGDVLVPTSMEMILRFTRNGVKVVEAFPLTAVGDGSWVTRWDSSVADSGDVSGHIRTDGSEHVAFDFVITVKAGLANPQG